MKHLYFMPGMAASDLIFENIQLPKSAFTCHFMHWIIPQKKESLVSYSTRLLEQIKHEKPVLIGVSFGGVIVQELSKLILVEKLIIISSVKTKHEFPRRMKFSQATSFHKLLPTGWLQHIDKIVEKGMGMTPKRLELYKKYLSVNDKAYLDWALHTIVNWQQDKPQEDVIHIHGDQDLVFPLKYINGAIVIKGGTHIMIINRYKWFNENLPKIILS